MWSYYQHNKFTAPFNILIHFSIWTGTNCSQLPLTKTTAQRTKRIIACTANETRVTPQVGARYTSPWETASFSKNIYRIKWKLPGICSRVEKTVNLLDVERNRFSGWGSKGKSEGAFLREEIFICLLSRWEFYVFVPLKFQLPSKFECSHFFFFSLFWSAPSKWLWFIVPVYKR